MELKKWWQGFLQATKSLFLIQPVIFIIMVYNLGYGLVNSVISLTNLSFFIGITGSYALIIGIAKIFGLKRLKQVSLLDNQALRKDIENKSSFNIAICAAVMSFLHFSFAIVSTFIHDEDMGTYTLWLVIFTATLAFINIIFAGIMSYKTRKDHSLIVHTIRLTDLANALIGIALTQRAILLFLDHPNARIISGVGSIFFSILAGLVCLLMFKKNQKRRLNQPKTDKL